MAQACPSSPVGMLQLMTSLPFSPLHSVWLASVLAETGLPASSFSPSNLTLVTLQSTLQNNWEPQWRDLPLLPITYTFPCEVMLAWDSCLPLLYLHIFLTDALASNRPSCLSLSAASSFSASPFYLSAVRRLSCLLRQGLYHFVPKQSRDISQSNVFKCLKLTQEMQKKYTDV